MWLTASELYGEVKWLERKDGGKQAGYLFFVMFPVLFFFFVLLMNMLMKSWLISGFLQLQM